MNIRNPARPRAKGAPLGGARIVGKHEFSPLSAPRTQRVRLFLSDLRGLCSESVLAHVFRHCDSRSKW